VQEETALKIIHSRKVYLEEFFVFGNKNPETKIKSPFWIRESAIKK